jgi:hypothetical protein
MAMHRISAVEPLYPVRLAVAQEIGAGGVEALEALRDCLGPEEALGDLELGWSDPARQTRTGPGKANRGRSADAATGELSEQEQREWREKVTRAWLAPLLLGSASRPARGFAQKNLEQWCRFVSDTDYSLEGPDLHLSLEVALALGFKHAANRRDQHPHAYPETRVYLVERARDLLRRTSFWFTRMTLVHALCLWALPDGPDGKTNTYRRHDDPKALVEDWATGPTEGPEHPFVGEARKLAGMALETGQPERFMWIDESGILGRVGSRPANLVSPRKHNLWIPPSAGWTALHPRAQQLVADVLLLLNLSERGARPSDRIARLRRTDRNDLPPCLAGDRTPLDPMRTVGMAGHSLPGSHCKTACRFELCPYPPKGEKSHRVEFSEAFARSQVALLNKGWPRRRTAPWQTAPPRDLRRFWQQMAQRAQTRKQWQR